MPSNPPTSPSPAGFSSVLPPRSSVLIPVRERILCTVQEACELVGLGERTIYRMITEGKFPKPVNPGIDRVMFRVDEIIRWAAGLGVRV